MNHLLEHFSAQLDDLKQQGNLRQFTSNIQQDRYITIQHKKMLNLASNDYLGLASDVELREQFFDGGDVLESDVGVDVLIILDLLTDDVLDQFIDGVAVDDFKAS